MSTSMRSIPKTLLTSKLQGCWLIAWQYCKSNTSITRLSKTIVAHDSERTDAESQQGRHHLADHLHRPAVWRGCLSTTSKESFLPLRSSASFCNTSVMSWRHPRE